MKKKTLIVIIMSLIVVAGLAISLSKRLACDTSESAIKSEMQGGEVGEGQVSFQFTVTDSDGKDVSFTVHTDEKTVGDALMKTDLISGENGPYGLYVKTVNGKTLDYDKDGKYWAFYVDGEYAVVGVDEKEIVKGEIYSFRAELL